MLSNFHQSVFNGSQINGRNKNKRQPCQDVRVPRGDTIDGLCSKLIRQYIAIFIFVIYCIVSWPMYHDAYRIVKSLPKPTPKVQWHKKKNTSALYFHVFIFNVSSVSVCPVKVQECTEMSFFISMLWQLHQCVY